MKILIAGATGLIGQKLGISLVKKGHRLWVISRDAAKAKEKIPYPCEVIEGNLSQGVMKNEGFQENFDVVVNLAGESVAGRWTERRKRDIYNSRIVGTRSLIESLLHPPKVFINASAAGYYGNQGDQEITEESLPGEGFLAQVCQDWEEELVAISCKETMATTRVVALRTGLVLNRHEGALATMTPLFRRSMGSVLGDGQQWMGWIHWADAVGLIVHAIENSSVRGPINVVAPNPVTNVEFTQALAHAMGCSVAPSVPRVIVKAALGEMSSLVLNSQRVLPTRALHAGYRFKYPDIQTAFEELFPSSERGEEVYAAEQYFPWKPEQIFPFFSDVSNLEKITPPSLSFKTLGEIPKPVVAGSEIHYCLKLHGVPVTWKTLIKEWEPPKKFVDIQLSGPYTLWHHTHEFMPLSEGTLMRDRVRYKVPLGAIGGLIAGAFVKTEIKKIFAFRRSYLAKNLVNYITT